MSIFSIARLVTGSTAANTINIPTVNIFLQKSPNKPEKDKRGISGVSFEVVKDGVVIQNGTTGADGKIVMQVPGGAATLRITASGATVDYAVSIRNDAIEDVATPEGQKRRLRMLGYHLGHAGPEGNGVDGAVVPTREMDRSIQEFQADTAAINASGNANAISGVANNNTQNGLTAAAEA
jgi:hypothetical protein